MADVDGNGEGGKAKAARRWRHGEGGTTTATLQHTIRYSPGSVNFLHDST